MLVQRFFSLLKQYPNKIILGFAAKKAAGPNIGQQFSQILLVNEKKQLQSAGRSWRTEELRLKSNEDLHKLWFVCVKEKNLLLSDQVIQSKFSQRKFLKFRINKVRLTMNRILGVVRERQNIRRLYRKKLEDQYIQKKRSQLRDQVSKKEQQLPQITWQMLREKYLELRKGVDNTKYLQRLWQKKQNNQSRRARMLQRLQKTSPKGGFKSFWQYEMSIGQRPLQQQILRAHIKNWKSLNLKQRKIILGFLNARRSKDAKTAFIKQLRILGDKIAQDQVKQRIEQSKKQ